MTELTAAIARVIQVMVKDKTYLDIPTANQVAVALAKNFDLKDGEVALMRVTGGGRQLEFIVPEELSKIGTLPLTSTTSVAVRAARDGRPETINNFPNVKHPTVFEAVPMAKGSRNPIQKIVSVPVLGESGPIGVIQISRKGKTAEEAGADFGPKELAEIKQVAQAIAHAFVNDPPKEEKKEEKKAEG